MVTKKVVDEEVIAIHMNTIKMVSKKKGGEVKLITATMTCVGGATAGDNTLPIIIVETTTITIIAAQAAAEAEGGDTAVEVEVPAAMDNVLGTIAEGGEGKGKNITGLGAMIIADIVGAGVVPLIIIEEIGDAMIVVVEEEETERAAVTEIIIAEIATEEGKEWNRMRVGEITAVPPTL